MADGFRRLAPLLFPFLLGMCLMIAFQSATQGHESWINNQNLRDPSTKQSCCNLHDCREETNNIERIETGYLVKSTGEVIAPERVIWRSPGGWWRCRFTNQPAPWTDNWLKNLPRKIGDTRCLIGPPMGS